MRLRKILPAVAAAGALLAAALGGLSSTTASAASSGCKVGYTVQSAWSGGFTASVSITNLGTTVSGWTLGFSFPDSGQKVVQGWSATWSQSGAKVTAASMNWNGTLAANATTSIGFVGSFTGANPVPASFTLNGATCDGTVTTPSPSPTPTVTPTYGTAPALHVSGNHLVTASGATYRLLGVNHSGGEFACVQGKGMWDGPVDQASIDAMKTWNIHAVRIPLNEECWLGNSDVPAGGTTGTAYQQAVKDYVSLLVANGMTPILDLHWTYGQYSGAGAGCSDTIATCQKPMPDAQYTPAFWTSVATAFKGNNAVIFDLFNEPYPDAAANWDATKGWTCWRDGGTCTGISYQVAGMQSLVNAVRATGATNVLMLGGLAWSNDLTQWLTYEPTDPAGNLVASWHTYNFNTCSNTSCFDSQVAPVAAKVPVQAGEIGQNSCAHDYVDTVMGWLDSHATGYTAWTWNAWGCSQGNVLITSADGTPTSTYGEGVKAHLLTQNP
jgi:endoglucanase